jgi:outer membrane receptor protein involved in Fe transport
MALMTHGLIAWSGLAAALLAAGLADGAELLSEIVVTARRAPQARIDFPGSIARVSDSDLETLQAPHYSVALNRVAGVHVQRGSGQEALLAIRSPVLTGAGSCGSFLVLEDGIAVRPVGFCNVNELFEVNTAQAQAIEVIKGPGPATYGANAAHGIINIVSRDGAASPTMQIGVERGSAHYTRISLAGSSSLGATHVSAYGNASRDGGFREATPTREAKLNLLASHQLAGGQLQLRLAGTVLNQETAGFIRGFDSYRDRSVARSNPNPEAYRDASSLRLLASWQNGGNEQHRARIDLALRRSSMDFLQHFLLGQPLEHNSHSSAWIGGSLVRPLARNAVLRAGASLERSWSELLELQAGPTNEGSAAARAIRPPGRHYDYEVSGTTAAGFIAAELGLAQHWRLDLGLRAEATVYDYDNLMRDGNTDEAGVPCAFGGCLYSRPADRRDRFVDLAPRVALTYVVKPTQRVFLSAARGFRPPEMTELYRLQRQQRISNVSGEGIDALEIGWLRRGERVGVDLTAFAQRKHDVILRDANSFNIDGGSTSHAGFEYELSWRLADQWQLAAAGTLAWHRYEFTRAIEGGELITRGNDVDTAPRHLHSLRLRWGRAADLAVELEARHVGRYFLDAANLRSYPGHTTSDLRVAWQASRRWRIGLRIDNLADGRYADRADFAQGEFRYFPGRGRSLFADVSYSTPAL